MELHGENLIGSETSREGSAKFQARNPQTGEAMRPWFADATREEVDRALTLADAAFHELKNASGEKRSSFLRAIGEDVTVEERKS